MWRLLAEPDHGPPLEEEYRRQGTAYRRARQLFAAGYTVTAVQYTAGADPKPDAVYRFDGIRFVRVPRLSPRT